MNDVPPKMKKPPLQIPAAAASAIACRLMDYRINQREINAKSMREQRDQNDDRDRNA
ncbi:MAG TPA: hypothetical protein VGM52_12115 [Herbaspirillum sp.]|jgi:hypothetical protein